MDWFDRDPPIPRGGRARDAAMSVSFYHLSFRSGSRAVGASSGAAHAYIMRTEEYDETSHPEFESRSSAWAARLRERPRGPTPNGPRITATIHNAQPANPTCRIHRGNERRRPPMPSAISSANSAMLNPACLSMSRALRVILNGHTRHREELRSL
jgi:hypothetical protein